MRSEEKKGKSWRKIVNCSHSIDVHYSHPSKWNDLYLASKPWFVCVCVLVICHHSVPIQILLAHTFQHFTIKQEWTTKTRKNVYHTYNEGEKKQKITTIQTRITLILSPLLFSCKFQAIHIELDILISQIIILRRWRRGTNCMITFHNNMRFVYWQFHIEENTKWSNQWHMLQSSNFTKNGYGRITFLI